ncbi:DNA polymerase III subunit beta [Castellaniella caeni]|uniref:DNA polymerase III subunit beta n=1 Tax=Castellaniella caeni TaxID=266123 RepID=UPI00082CEEE5|nr:DNA polymerase III subunit beta [Castellaniella caeni]
MLLIQATRDAVLKPLTTVVGIVERRNTLPILANVLIRKQGNQVAFVANDLEVQITTHADFGVGDDVQSTTVAARKFLDILRALPDTGEVRLSLDDNKLTVQAGRSRFALQTLSADDYPTVSQAEQWGASFSMPQKDLKQLFNMVHFSMAQQDIRYYLNGLLLVLEPGRVRAVSTDGHRLAHSGIAVEGLDAQLDAIIPRKTIHEMQRLLGDGDSPVQVDIAAGQIRFRFDQIELVSKLVEGKFPDYKRVIPTGYTRHVLIAREALQASLQRAAILTTDKLKGVRLQLGDNLLRISSSNAEQEEAREELEVDYAQESLDVAFNVTYLLDVLGNVKTNEICWSVQPDVNASVLITLPDDDEFKYVVMPMRI